MFADLPKFVFFTGKGGVGKTSLACATAVQLADAGKRVLLVSTDPASNVGQVFGVAIGNHVTAIDSVSGLSALEIDPEAAAAEYRGSHPRSDPGKPAGKGAQGHRGAAFRRLHHRDRRLRRVHGAAHRRHAHWNVRPHHLRHRADRAYHPPPEAARRLERLPRGGHGRRLLPRAARGPGEAADAIPRPPSTASLTERSPG